MEQYNLGEIFVPQSVVQVIASPLFLYPWSQYRTTWRQWRWGCRIYMISALSSFTGFVASSVGGKSLSKLCLCGWNGQERYDQEASCALWGHHRNGRIDNGYRTWWGDSEKHGIIEASPLDALVSVPRGKGEATYIGEILSDMSICFWGIGIICTIGISLKVTPWGQEICWGESGYSIGIQFHVQDLTGEMHSLEIVIAHNFMDDFQLIFFIHGHLVTYSLTSFHSLSPFKDFETTFHLMIQATWGLVTDYLGGATFFKSLLRLWCIWSLPWLLDIACILNSPSRHQFCQLDQEPIH